MFSNVWTSIKSNFIEVRMEIGKSFHLKYLENEFAKRLQKNPHYSLRSFARDLEVPVSWLSEFLHSKKGMSHETAQSIGTILNLSSQELEIFTLSARAAHARRLEDRKAALAELKTYKVVDAFKMKTMDFADIGAWYHQTILELTEVDDFQHTELDIAQRLRLPLPTIKRAVQTLQNKGLLKVENGKMVALYSETQSPMDTPSLDMRRYQVQILEKATTALHEQPKESREFFSVTFAFNSKRMTEAKKSLRKFQKKFTDEFYSASDAKDSVYQLSVQFFRMDQKGK